MTLSTVKLETRQTVTAGLIPRLQFPKIDGPKTTPWTYGLQNKSRRLLGPAAKVFPLLCPVREMDWAEGWEPEKVISESGVAERNCVFLTPDKDGSAIWYITRHEPDTGFIEMLKFCRV